MMDFDDVLLFINSEYWAWYIEMIFNGFLNDGCNVFIALGLKPLPSFFAYFADIQQDD